MEVSGDSTNSRHHAGMFLWTDKHLEVLCEEATAVFRGNVPLTRCCILPFVVGPQRLINLILVDLHFSKFINMLGGSASRNATHLYLKSFSGRILAELYTAFAEVYRNFKEPG